jgi:hypothetical protein
MGLCFSFLLSQLVSAQFLFHGSALSELPYMTSILHDTHNAFHFGAEEGLEEFVHSQVENTVDGVADCRAEQSWWVVAFSEEVEKTVYFRHTM